MGRALKNLTVFQEVENKPYPTWDSVLDRSVIVDARIVRQTSLHVGCVKGTWINYLTESVQGFWLSVAHVNWKMAPTSSHVTSESNL